MLDVRRLRLLHELSLRGTLAEVAEALHQTPSSVSQQLGQLEREAGVELLRKVGRRVQLTAAAEVLVGHTEAILAHLEQATADLSALDAGADSLTGTVRIAVFQSAALALMPRMLADLGSSHPRLRVVMSQREPESALRETWMREFDLVIAEQYPDHAAPWHHELDRVALTTDPLRLAVPGDGDALSSIGAAARAPWVMEPHGTASRHWAEQACRSAGFEPDVRYETADLQAHVALIEAGLAVAILPGLMRTPPSLRLVDLPGRPHRTIFTATRTPLTRTPAIAACRAALLRAV